MSTRLPDSSVLTKDGTYVPISVSVPRPNAPSVSVPATSLAGGTDEQLLAWAHEKGGARTDEECEIWNGFMMKRGWRDAGADILAKRIRESHLESKTVLTMFDYIDFDEDRDPVTAKSWMG